MKKNHRWTCPSRAPVPTTSAGHSYRIQSGCSPTSSTSAGSEAGLLSELAPGRVDRRLGRLQAALGELPVAGDVGPLERQDLPVGPADDGDHPGAEVSAPHAAPNATGRHPRALGRERVPTHSSSRP